MRKKITIQKKFFLGYLFIFSISLLLLSFVTSNMLQQNSENIVKDDVVNIQNHSREWLKQYFLIHNVSKDAFLVQGDSLAEKLSEQIQTNVSLYDRNGNFLLEAVKEQGYVNINTSPSEIILESSDEDLEYALDNQAAYTINKLNSQTLVNFSYPLYIHGELYGILRFTKDYTPLFQANDRVLKSITAFTLVLFFVIFLFSFVLARKIIKPLSKVMLGFQEVAKGNYDTVIDIQTGDEIEELSKQFDVMKWQIKKQIEIVKQEKEKVEKLELSRRDFFNNVTHELKTPLTTISGYSQILADENFNDPIFLQKAADRIKKESDRLHEMVIEMIELSKNVHDVEKIELAPLIKQVCDDMQLKATNKELMIHSHFEAAVVSGNSNRLVEVFSNLLDNAIKYSEPGLSLYVSSFVTGSKVEIHFTNTCNGNELDDSELTKIFEPFYRGRKTNSKKDKGSLGLGLYICKQITEEHGGSISVHLNESKITFSVQLPLWQ